MNDKYILTNPTKVMNKKPVLIFLYLTTLGSSWVSPGTVGICSPSIAAYFYSQRNCVVCTLDVGFDHDNWKKKPNDLTLSVNHFGPQLLLHCYSNI